MLHEDRDLFYETCFELQPMTRIGESGFNQEGTYWHNWFTALYDANKALRRSFFRKLKRAGTDSTYTRGYTGATD